MRLRWTVPAADDLENIKNHLQQNYPDFAEPTVWTIYQRIRLLKTSPNSGRPGHRSGTRELALTPLPYVVVYAVKPTPSKSCISIMVRKTGADLKANFAADRDAQPLAETDFKRLKRTLQAKIIRRALELTQEEFAARYHIPLGTLRDWEQGRAEPDQPTRAYLTLIARDPDHVNRTLNPKSD